MCFIQSWHHCIKLQVAINGLLLSVVKAISHILVYRYYGANNSTVTIILMCLIVTTLFVRFYRVSILSKIMIVS